jgi:hypothetical protein
MRGRLLPVVSALLLLSSTGFASAGPIVLDQCNVGTPSSYLNGGSDDYAWQQGFTAGLTGQLTQIDLFVGDLPYYGDPATTQVSVYLGAPWQSGVAAWSTVGVFPSGWASFDLTAAGIQVVAGTQYAIGIHGRGWNIFNPGIGLTYDDQYTGGELFLNGSTADVGVVGNDMLFRTYVDTCSAFPGGGATGGCFPGPHPFPGHVPDPGSTLLLFGISLVGLRAWRRRWQ